MENTTSPRNASSAVAAICAPRSASRLAGSGERFQTRKACPASSNRAAMALPILPSPMNPMSITPSGKQVSGPGALLDRGGRTCQLIQLARRLPSRWQNHSNHGFLALLPGVEAHALQEVIQRHPLPAFPDSLLHSQQNHLTIHTSLLQPEGD